MSADITQAVRLMLRDVEDATLLKDTEDGPHSLHDLLLAWQMLAADDAHLPTLTPESTAGQLKEAIAELDPAHALIVLARYRAQDSHAHKHARLDSTPDRLHIASMQTQIYVLALVLAVMLALGTVFAALAVFIHLGLVTPTAALQDMLQTLRDALRTFTRFD
ncbi:hypothetical protein [Paraburkholderia adhaesiva]|uniref:hypothetical protein n=1 Tax=Paraburkholderia adhaesiva TaxID=2883244 RepID=UPI001F3A9A3B|nr:hypothetical protein [Paraburkholderia adhaesiva]